MITQEVVNYPVPSRNPTDRRLLARMVEQCDEFGAGRVYDEVVNGRHYRKYKDYRNFIRKTVTKLNP
jgi:hypothetical protein